ncbi:hypothetical protein HPB50_023392 [Hyalomma asiaticum]|uniref:Uncharacterized protein n=1 Tax=Hyalomma asiaticum TaxID=266040 RepID=A0ACB7S8M7_HYAAI|nr:hypothetical protein HPB50_023392 [Hyalomma asiaticum]
MARPSSVTSSTPRLEKEQHNQGTLRGHGTWPAGNMSKSALLFMQAFLWIMGATTASGTFWLPPHESHREIRHKLAAFRRNLSGPGEQCLDGSSIISDVINTSPRKGAAQPRNPQRARHMACRQHV